VISRTLAGLTIYSDLQIPLYTPMPGKPDLLYSTWERKLLTTPGFLSASVFWENATHPPKRIKMRRCNI